MDRRLHDLSSRLRRLAKRDAPPAPLEPLEPILIRSSRDGDRGALERVAALDSRTLAAGSFLLAEVERELVAAAPLAVDEEPLKRSIPADGRRSRAAPAPNTSDPLEPGRTRWRPRISAARAPRSGVMNWHRARPLRRADAPAGVQRAFGCHQPS
jgi:hypothetical protein